MEPIVEISERVLQFLLTYQQEQQSEGKAFYFTLRKSNQNKRLEYRYWFLGNENYMVVSFWSGMDWRNKTPNIFIRITNEGKTFISLSAKDSIKKAAALEKFLVSSLNLDPDGTDRWKRELFFAGYIEALSDFLKREKVFIDSVVDGETPSLKGEDASNNIEFLDEVQFQKSLDKINEYRNSAVSKLLPVSLTSLRVQQYIPIKDVSIKKISPDSAFIFLVGENGSGKSSLLKAIAIALGNSYYTEGMEPDNSAWIINFSYQIKGATRKVKITNFQPKSKRTKEIPFACYGPMRMMTNKVIEPGTRRKAKTGPLSSLFLSDGLLLDFNRWMLNGLSDKENRSRNKNRYENIKQILINTIPNLYDIRTLEFDGGDIVPQVLYFENDFDGNKIPNGVLFEHLSSGIKSLVALLGDMLVRLFDVQPGIEDPAELEGIVLIDEIDIHLHPNWQKKVPELLVKNFPKLQFIATTHSPIPLLGAPENSELYNVSRKSSEGVVVKPLNYINISNLLPNTILTSPIFGMDGIVSVNNKKIENVKVDDNYDDEKFFGWVDEKLNQLAASENIRNKKYFE
jgi:predicted ATPase